MLIECENCNKKFKIEESLIPKDGRLLQCGSCNHKWFYKKIDIDQPLKLEEDKIEKVKIEEDKIEEVKIEEDKIEDIKIKDPEDLNLKKQESNKKINKKSFNIFKIFFVFIITFIAIILLLDTFKSQISLIFPDIENFLNNLYQSILDVTLFFKDLIK